MTSSPPQFQRRTPLLAILPLLLLLPLLRLPPADAASVPGEAEVKAAFVHRFLPFVEWPAIAFRSADDPIVLLVAGNGPAADAVGRLAGKSAAGRRVSVHRVRDARLPERAHVLFVAQGGKADAALAAEAYKGSALLTVGDAEGFVGQGGMIGLVRAGDQVGFEIDEEAARKAGLRISAKLLYLGRPPAGRAQQEAAR